MRLARDASSGKYFHNIHHKNSFHRKMQFADWSITYSFSKQPSVYSVGDVLNFSNSNGEEYSVCITDWGTSVDGSILDIFSLKTVTWFQYVIMNTGDEEVTVSDNIFNIYADDYSVDTEWSEEGTFLETLAPGKKTSGKVYAEMDADEVNKIEVQIHDSTVLIKDGQSGNSGDDDQSDTSDDNEYEDEDEGISPIS